LIVARVCEARCFAQCVRKNMKRLEIVFFEVGGCLAKSGAKLRTDGTLSAALSNVGRFSTLAVVVSRRGRFAANFRPE
jgi:hypothetical protein